MGYTIRRGLITVKCDICKKTKIVSRDKANKLKEEGWIWGTTQKWGATQKINHAACPEHSG